MGEGQRRRKFISFYVSLGKDDAYNFVDSHWTLVRSKVRRRGGESRWGGLT